MERILLESRQLTPAITDRQLIKKIARHLGRELEIAVVTRGVNTIPNFESLILEYANIHQRSNRERSFDTTNGNLNARDSESHKILPTPSQNKGFGMPQQGWGNKNEKVSERRQYTRANDRQQLNTVEFVNNRPSTSHAEVKPNTVREKKN